MRTLLAILALLAVCVGHAAAATRPNVVIFLADDSGWGDYRYCGNTNLATPNIDSLARGGRCWIASACARCARRRDDVGHRGEHRR